MKPVVPVKLEDFADAAKVDSWIREKNMVAFGEGRLILTDIRSDGTTDSARAADLALLVSIHDSAAGAQFERRGRPLTQRRLFTHGDTLSGEIFYTFRTPLAVDGLAWTRERFSIVIPAGADIVKTNGEVEDWLGGAKRIRWDLDARRLMYRVCERQVRPSVSLSALYRDRIYHYQRVLRSWHASSVSA